VALQTHWAFPVARRLSFRWSKKFSDRFSRFDTIPECDSQPPSQPASQPRCRSKYRAYAHVKMLAILKILRKKQRSVT